MPSGWRVVIIRSETPFYGVCLLILAFGACDLASITHLVWAAAPIYAGAAAVAAVGFVMTFRDYG